MMAALVGSYQTIRRRWARVPGGPRRHAFSYHSPL